MKKWHPSIEPLHTPLMIDTRGERLSLVTLFKIGGVLMLVTAGALVTFLSLEARTTDENVDEFLMPADTAGPIPPVMKGASKPALIDSATIEPAAPPPSFLAPEATPRWQMDLGRWSMPQPDEAPAPPPIPAMEEAEAEVASREPSAEPDPWPERLESIDSSPGTTIDLPLTDAAPDAAGDADKVAVSAQAVAAITPDATAQPVAGRPLISIVIDDLGNNPGPFERLLTMPAKPTLAFLPYPAGTPSMAGRAHARGYEIFLHMPMQPEGGQDPGPDALTVGLADAVIADRLRAALDRVPGAVGVNNHMGSAFTSDRRGMDRVLLEIGRRGLVFVDSRTTGHSVVSAAAAVSGTAMTSRDIFLDHDPSPAAIQAQLSRVEAFARRHGAVVAIGHPYDTTIDALEAWLPDAIARGFEFVPVREVIAKRQCARQPVSSACDPAMFVAELRANAVR